MGKWMDTQIDGWVDGRKEASMSRWVNGWWIDGWMCMDGWMGERKDKRMDGWCIDR